MPLNREQFLAKKVSKHPILFKLSDGDEVYLLPISAKMYRDYKRSLRDEDGIPIEDRQTAGDELLAARCLVDESGNRLFTDEEVLDGIFDEMEMLPMADVIRRTYEMLGIGEPVEKKSSPTGSINPS